MYALFLDSLIFIGYCVLSFPRAILSDIFKGISKDSIAMVTGNLLHQVLQGLLVEWAESKKTVSMSDIGKMITDVLSTTAALNHL